MERDEYGRFLPRSYQEQQRQHRGPAAAGMAAGAASSPWYGAASPCDESSATRHGAAATALGVIAGAGLGAAAMFLLDPEQGRRRREHLAEAAGSALESTTDTVRHAWEAGTEKAIEGAAAVYAAAPSRRDLRRGGHRMTRRLGSALGSTRDTAGDWLESARAHLPSLPHRRSHSHEHNVSATTAGVGAAGALLLGLGAMWLFDPNRGRARRAWIGQKTHRLLNETGRFMRATGRHVANKSRGYYYESRKGLTSAGQTLSDSTLAERVRAGLGHLSLRSTSSVGVQCLDGCVTLTGRCIPDDVDAVMASARDTQGVHNVINHMEVSDRFGSPASGTPTSL